MLEMFLNGCFAVGRFRPGFHYDQPRIMKDAYITDKAFLCKSL